MSRGNFKAESATLDDQFAERMRKPIRKVWGMVATDVMRDAETMGERIDNECAIECCIDADRISYEARDSHAAGALDAVLTKYGYPEVLRFLSNRIRLV
jgi:hypothetical protein